MTEDLSRTTAICSTRVTVPIWRAVRQAAIEQGRTIQVVVEEALTSWLARQGVTGVVLADPVEKKRIEDIVIQTLADRQIQRKYGPRKAYPNRLGTTVDVHGVALAGDGERGSHAGTAPPPVAPTNPDRSALLHGFTEAINDGDPELMAERLERGEIVAPNRGTSDPELGF